MEEFVSHPPRRVGFIVHTALIVLVAAAGLLGLLQATRARVGPTLLLYLLPALVAVFLIPLLIYRLSALLGASYTIERDGMHLRWGLRSEDIPMDAVQWVGRAADYKSRLAKPLINLPGAVLGLRQKPGVLPVEYMAAHASPLILITTAERIFAISPEDEQVFLNAFRRASELGSITPIQARAAYPGLLLTLSLTDPLPRNLMLVGLALGLLLMMWVVLVIADQEQVSLRIWGEGGVQGSVPAVRLLLLPVLNLFFYIIDAILGLFFYRRSESRPAAYMMWGSSILSSLLFMAAIYFISRAV